MALRNTGDLAYCKSWS